MPNFYDPGTIRIPEEGPSIPYWDGSNPRGGGGGMGPYTPPSVFPPIGGGPAGGGGGSGGFFQSQGYRPFGGFDPQGVTQRKRRMGAYPGGMPTSPGFGPSRGGFTGMSGGRSEALPYQPLGRPDPGMNASGGWNDPTRNAGDDYFNTVMGYFASGNADNLAGEALANLILAGRGQGQWGVEGNPMVNAIYERDANRRGMGMEQAALLGASMDTRDPWARSLARIEARNTGQRAKADFFNQNALNNASRYQSLIDSLLRGKLGGEYTMDDDYRRAEWQRAQGDAQRRHENSLAPWQIFGDITGKVAGAYAGK